MNHHRTLTMLSVSFAFLLALTACAVQAVGQETEPASPAPATPKPVAAATATAIPRVSTDTVPEHDLVVAPVESESSLPPSLETLNVVVPPCVPYPDSNVNPCERRNSWESLTSHYLATEWTLTPEAPTIEESYLNLNGGLAAKVPQIVVRMIPIPGTTRCAKVESFGLSFSFVESEAPSKRYHYTRCFVDLAIDEYIVGTGPARLTIDMGVFIDNFTGERLRAEEVTFAAKFEGTEWIAFLTGPTDPSHAVWRLYWHWDVQLREDGEVVVVNALKDLYDSMSHPEFATINASRTEIPLSDYRSQVKRAHANYYAMTSGRIGTGLDFYGNRLPFAATEATDVALNDYIGQIRAVDGLEFAILTPPPVPGENDPNSDGPSINDIIATRVAGGISIPGGLEGTATPEAEAAPTATPKPVPTPEPEATASLGISTDAVAETETFASVTPTAPPTSQLDIVPVLTPTPRPSQQLNVIVPPCIPYPGSEVDPCSRRDTWEYHNPFRRISILLPDIFWSLRDLVVITDKPTFAPHFIVRAIVIPGSIRCGNAEFELWMISSYNDSFSESLLRGDSHCFVDLAINEYIVGGGPNRLTVNTTVQPCWAVGDEPACGADEWKIGTDRLRATGIEGVEWIFSLGGPGDLGALAWDIVRRWDVQLREDGEVVVVDRFKRVVLQHSSPENFNVNLSRVEHTLNDFRSIVKEAHQDLVKLTQGRISTRTDVRGQPAARMALDAGPTALSDFVFSMTAIEMLNAIPTSPPPVPGENDPNSDGLTVYDIIATRVASGIRIPDGLEGTPTPETEESDE